MRSNASARISIHSNMLRAQTREFGHYDGIAGGLQFIQHLCNQTLPPQGVVRGDLLNEMHFLQVY